MQRMIILSGLALLLGGVSSEAVEPTAESCQAAVDAARAQAESLPQGDLSRRAAESYLVQAKVEAGNGEFDDCLDLAAHASIEVREHRHILQPGETLDVPTPPAPSH